MLSLFSNIKKANLEIKNLLNFINLKISIKDTK